MALLKIRRYEQGDFESVWELHNVALAATGSHVGNGWWDNDLHNIESEYFAKGGEFLVGQINGCIAAMGALEHKSETRAAIRRMRVHPDFQRQGFGQQILEALEEIACHKGYKTLELDTTILQISAQKLYIKNGYREVTRRMVRFETIFYEKEI